MILDTKTKSGLAFNQNVLLEHYYKYRNSPCNKRGCNLCYMPSRVYRDDQTLGLTCKQEIKAKGRLHSKGYIKRRRGCTYSITDIGIKAIENNDYIRSGPMGPHTGKCQKLIKGTLISYLWAALRTKNIATIENLLLLVPIEQEDYDKTYKNARRLLHWLCKAYIVRKLPQKQAGVQMTSPGFNRYQLMIDLGPKHPVIRVRKHQLYDQNSQTNIPFKEVVTAFKSPFKQDLNT